MATLEDLDLKQAELIRKVQAAAVFYAAPDTAVPVSFTSGASAALTALPAGWTDIGLVTKDDAYSWSRNVEQAETRSHGFLDPTRRDVTGNVSSLAFTAQETKLKTLEVYHNVDLTGVEAAAVTGEFTFNDPLQAQTRYHRVITVGRDGAGANAIYLIRVMPRAMLSEPGEQSWSDENELTYPITMTATPDSTLGYSMRYVFAGPGWLALLEKMGIEQASA